MTQTATRKQTEIQSAVVFRCTDKTTGEIFYAVKSDSSDQMYKVTFNEVTRRYEDTCPACSECKHVRAVREVVKAKAEMGKQGFPACPISQELKTVFSSVEEEFEYKLGAYGKRIAYEWLYEQKHTARTAAKLVAQYREDGQMHTVVCIDGQFADTTTDAEVVAAVEEVKAEAKMDAFRQGMDEQYAADPRQGLSQGEREAAQSVMRHLYDEY